MAKKLYDEYAAEVELEDEVKVEDEEVAEIHLPKEDKKDGEKKDRKWLNRILSLILGFFIGVISVWSTIAAVACFVLFQPIDNTVGVVDTFTGGEFSDLVFGEDGKAGLLDEKYAELKVKDLLGDSFDAIKQLSSENGSLAPLNEVSPKVGSVVDSLIKGLDKYGIPLDRNKMLNLPLKKGEDKSVESLGSYFKTSLLEAPAGEFFKALGSDMSPIIMALCYGVEGTDYVVGEDGTVTMLGTSQKTTLNQLLNDNMNSAFDDVLLCDALDVKADSNKILISIAYGNDYEISGNDIICDNPRTIGELRTSKGAFMNDIPLTSVLEEDRSNGVTMYMLYGKEGIHYGIDADNNIVMKEQRILVLAKGGNSYQVYNEYAEPLTAQQGTAEEEGYVAGYTLNFGAKSYIDKTGHEYVLVNARAQQETKDGTADVYYLRETDGSQVFYPVHDLGDLDGNDNLVTKINSRLTIGELMDKDDIDNNKFLKHVKDYTIEDLPKALEDLSINEVYADEIYDANGNVQGAWRYLVCTYENGNLVEHEYTLNHLDPLIDNMKENIHQTTLFKLAEDGMISFSDDTLNHSIKTEVYSPDAGAKVPVDLDFLHGKTKIGELTLDEMIEYTDTIVQLI